jgi:hypothetical protein
MTSWNVPGSEVTNGGAYWRARISPASTPAEIFAAWERDYRAEYEQLTRQNKPAES